MNLPGRGLARFSQATEVSTISSLARPLQQSLTCSGLGEPRRRGGGLAWEGRSHVPSPARLRRAMGEPMENALLIGLSRQIALHRELEVVANNIANLSTTGYKADGSVFEEFLSPVASHGQFQGADRRLSYVHDRATWHDLRPGPVQPTGNPLDVAIDGNAFFVVQTPRGERYTRNGAFQIDATGQLVTSEGYAVQGDGGPIQFQLTDNSIVIADDGTIRVREGSNTRSDSIRGKFRLV